MIVIGISLFVVTMVPQNIPGIAVLRTDGYAAPVSSAIGWTGGGTIAALFAAFPVEFIYALAGLALLSTITNSLYTAVNDRADREAAVITFVVTASGFSLFGIGAAFRGLVAGAIATLVFKYGKQ